MKVDNSYEKVMLSHCSSITTVYKEEAMTKFNECVNAYYHCTSQILDLLKLIRLECSRLPLPDEPLRYSQPQTPTFSNNNCIKLPPCDTEVFYGSYEQWPSFRDMFTAIYINHSKLTPVTKLYHLRNKTKV